MDYKVSSSSIREDKQKMQRRTSDVTSKQAEERVNRNMWQKCIYLRNPNKSNQWLSPGKPAQPVLSRKALKQK